MRVHRRWDVPPYRHRWKRHSGEGLSQVILHDRITSQCAFSCALIYFIDNYDFYELLFFFTVLLVLFFVYYCRTNEKRGEAVAVTSRCEKFPHHSSRLETFYLVWKISEISAFVNILTRRNNGNTRIVCGWSMYISYDFRYNRVDIKYKLYVIYVHVLYPRVLSSFLLLLSLRATFH